MRYGYIRVSSEEQNLARQQEAMEKEGIASEKVYCEKKSGKDMEREELQQLLKVVNMGDSITITDITRLGRSIRDIVNLVYDLDKKGITIISIKDNINTSTEIGKVFIMITGIFAEMELNAIKERQRQGIEAAKKAGRFTGRPRIKMDNFEQVYQQFFNNQISLDQALKLLECSRATFYRRVQQYDDNKVLDSCKILKDKSEFSSYGFETL